VGILGQSLIAWLSLEEMVSPRDPFSFA